MRLILLGVDDDDRKTLETHLFARQFGLVIKNNCGYLYVDIAMPEDLNFLSAILKCDFRFTLNGFQLNGKRFSTLELIREEEQSGENKNSRYGVLPKEQVV